MKIQELANKTGLSVYTIRYYENQGMLDTRHVFRDANNYRNYSDAAIARLKLIKKLQGVGCSIAELREILHDRDANRRTNRQVIEWIRRKIEEIEKKKREHDQMLETLRWMLEYRIAMESDPERARKLLEQRHFE